MKGLTKEQLISVMYAYNRYIQYANDENLYADGWFPVCIDEFYQNDYEYWGNKQWQKLN